MASLSDVAKVAGVSLTTASLVLNRPKQPNRVSEACALRVREAAKKLGYVPNYHARSMKLGKAEAIAVAMDVGSGDGNATVSELTDAYFNHLMGGIELHLRNVGYQMGIIAPDRHVRAPERGLQGMCQRRFDGMIVLGAVIDPSRANLVAESPDAAIVAIQYSGETELPVVDYDERKAVELAVDHLLGLGHRRLLWVGRSDLVGVLPGGHREEIFHETVRKRGGQSASCRFAPPDPSGVTSRTVLADEAHRCVMEFIAREGLNFTAVVAYNDPIALGVCSALAEANVHVPQQVSVMGFDDIEAALCIPRLTTVSHRLYDMGKKAAELVMKSIEGNEARETLRGSRHVLEPELILRKSTGRAGE